MKFSCTKVVLLLALYLASECVLGQKRGKNKKAGRRGKIPNIREPSQLYENAIKGKLVRTEGECKLGPVTIDGAGYEKVVMVKINNNYWFNSLVCGMCMEITADGKKYLGVINDRFHDQQIGKYRINGKIALKTEVGTVDGADAEWKAIECPTEGETLKYKFLKENPYHADIEFSNFKYPIKEVEFQKDGTNWQKVGKQSYDNIFTLGGGVAMDGVIEMKVTDIKGETVVEGRTNGWDLDFTEFDTSPGTSGTQSTAGSTAGSTASSSTASSTTGTTSAP